MKAIINLPNITGTGFVRCLIFCGLLLAVNSAAFGSVPGLPGDYNFDGIVAHGDFSVLGDTFGQTVPPGTGADGNFDGLINPPDYDLYRANYGNTAAFDSNLTFPLGTLPLSVTSSATVSGDVQWVLTFSHVTGALGGHLNIDTHGPEVLSAVGGSAFFDVKGRNWLGAVNEGIVRSGTHAFAGRGTTLGSHPSDASLVFLTLVTQGLQPTTLSITGEYGYQGQDYSVSQTASFVPEPASVAIVGLASIAIGLLTTRQRNRRRR